MGSGLARAVDRAGSVTRRRGALAVGGAFAAALPRRIQRRPSLAARRSAQVGGRPRVWAQRGALPPHGSLALGTAAHRADARRRHRPSRAPWRSGDPPAPLSLPRCPGHHQPRGIPITSVSRTLLDLAATARPSELERALAQAERL